MPKFNIKDLMIATTLVAVGFGLTVFAYRESWWGDYPNGPDWTIGFRLSLFFVGAGTIGIGAMYPLKTNLFINAAGVVVAIIVSIVLVGVTTGGCGQ